MICATGAQPCPLRFEILGSGAEAEKLRRRLACALGGLGWSAGIPIRTDAEAALNAGATRDPVLLADDVLFAQGLPRTEDLEELLRTQIGVPPAARTMP
ncbi:hypothetical protein [Thiomonas sp. FB-Cd]|jgi:hypothetical protein|uniref:hypothetical protein n=1 Tax=Thiomonas sp. FB-Cd TaxID=1158292 RepID=UPI00068A1BDE|nr:hypothetical protein [Thiomonas sp. FB-Cd]